MAIQKLEKTEEYFKENASDLNIKLGGNYSFIVLYKTKSGEVNYEGINPTDFEKELNGYEALLTKGEINFDNFGFNLENEMINDVLRKIGVILADPSKEINLSGGIRFSPLAGQKYIDLTERIWGVNQEIICTQMEALTVEPTYAIEDIQIESKDGN